MGLVKKRADDRKYSPSSLVSVTKKGMKVAVKIKEIIDVLE